MHPSSIKLQAGYSTRINNILRAVMSRVRQCGSLPRLEKPVNLLPVPPDGFSISHSVFPIPRPSVLMHDSRDVNLAFLYLV